MQCIIIGIRYRPIAVALLILIEIKGHVLYALENDCNHDEAAN